MVIFAEPIQVGAQNTTGLIPGDQLLEVNGKNVTQMTRDEVIAFIQKSGNSVTLKVRPLPELSELTSKEIVPELEINEPSGRGDLQLRPTNFVRTGSRRMKQVK